MKKIFKILFTLIVIVLIVGIVGIKYIDATYDMNTLKTIKQLKIVNESVNEESLCDNRFTEEDKTSTEQVLLEATGSDVFTGENGDFTLDFDKLNSNIKTMIKLTDRQIASIADTQIRDDMDSKIEIGGQNVGLELLQIKFANTELGNSDINTIVKLDIRDVKKSLTSFPVKYFKSYLPDYLYISSTIRITKTASTPFAYTNTSKAFTINNLSSDDTAECLSAINKLFSVGTAEEFNLTIGNTITDALIGNEEEPGFAYSFKDYGAKDFIFDRIDNESYFVIERGLII